MRCVVGGDLSVLSWIGLAPRSRTRSLSVWMVMKWSVRQRKLGRKGRISGRGARGLTRRGRFHGLQSPAEKERDQQVGMSAAAHVSGHYCALTRAEDAAAEARSVTQATLARAALTTSVVGMLRAIER